MDRPPLRSDSSRLLLVPLADVMDFDRLPQMVGLSTVAHDRLAYEDALQFDPTKIPFLLLR